jgi:hypothetical protein
LRERAWSCTPANSGLLLGRRDAALRAKGKVRWEGSGRREWKRSAWRCRPAEEERGEVGVVEVEVEEAGVEELDVERGEGAAGDQETADRGGAARRLFI